ARRPVDVDVAAVAGERLLLEWIVEGGVVPGRRARRGPGGAVVVGVGDLGVVGVPVARRAPMVHRHERHVLPAAHRDARGRDLGDLTGAVRLVQAGKDLPGTAVGAGHRTGEV